MSKRIALLLFGMFYNTSYFNHNTLKKSVIDFRFSVANYKRFIFLYYKRLGYEVDVFFCTNDVHDSKIKKNLIKTYKPKEHVFVKTVKVRDKRSRFFNRNYKVKKVVELCNDYRQMNNIDYEFVIMTRFDLEFKINFGDVDIDYNKINLVSVLEEPDFICDNFYIIPGFLLNDFYDMIRKQIYISHHHIKDELEEISEINYIKNEFTYIEFLTFYKIIRNTE